MDQLSEPAESYAAPKAAADSDTECNNTGPKHRGSEVNTQNILPRSHKYRDKRTFRERSNSSKTRPKMRSHFRSHSENCISTREYKSAAEMNTAMTPSRLGMNKEHTELINNEMIKNRVPKLRSSENCIYSRCNEKPDKFGPFLTMSDKNINANNDELSLNIYNLWRNRRFCDVVLRVGGETLYAHKLVMLAKCEHLVKEADESQNNILEYEFPGIKAAAMKNVLEYMYTSQITISEETVEDCLDISARLGIREVRSLCQEFLKEVSIDSVVRHRNIAMKFEMQQIIESLNAFIVNNFDSLIVAPSFLHSDFYAVYNILSSEIHTSIPDLIIFNACAAWLSHDLAQRINFAAALMGLVRFVNIPPEELVASVEPERSIFEVPKCKEMLYEAFRYHALSREFLERRAAGCAQTEIASDKSAQIKMAERSNLVPSRTGSLASMTATASGQNDGEVIFSNSADSQGTTVAKQTPSTSTNLTSSLHSVEHPVSDPAYSGLFTNNATRREPNHYDGRGNNTLIKSANGRLVDPGDEVMDSVSSQSMNSFQSTTHRAVVNNLIGKFSRLSSTSDAQYFRLRQTNFDPNRPHPQVPRSRGPVYTLENSDAFRRWKENERRFSMARENTGHGAETENSTDMCANTNKQLPVDTSDVKRHLRAKEQKQQRHVQTTDYTNERKSCGHANGMRYTQKTIEHLQENTEQLHGNITVMGGHDKSVNQYNLCTNTWSMCARLPEPLLYSGVTVLHGKLYVTGGHRGSVDDDEPIRTCYCFNPQKNLWKITASLKTARAWHAAVSLGNSIYVIGGEDCMEMGIQSVERLNVEKNKWHFTRPMSESRLAVSAVSHRGQILVAGGVSDPTEQRLLDTVEVYNPRTGHWTAKHTLPFAVCSASIAEIEGKVYMIGGYVSKSNENLSVNTVLRYDDDRDRWDGFTTLIVPRQNALVCGIGTWMFVIGGESSADDYRTVQEVECIDVNTNEHVTGVAPLLPIGQGIRGCVL